MQGSIVSITERFGFIKASDGVSHHFSPRSMAKDQPYDALAIGKLVEFTPAAGPKGMKALKVRLVQTYTGRTVASRMLTGRAGDNVFSAEDLAGTHLLVHLKTTWHRSPSDAKDELFHCVNEVGGNCLIEMQLYKQTFRDGNYHYTMHSWGGLAGCYFEDNEYQNEEEARQAGNEAREHAMGAKDKLTEIALYLDGQRALQERSGAGGVVWVIIIVIVLACILFAFDG